MQRYANQLELKQMNANEETENPDNTLSIGDEFKTYFKSNIQLFIKYDINVF